MQLDHDWVMQQGEDAFLLHTVSTCHTPLEAPNRIAVAVSGGGDSMALLHLAYRVAEQTGQSLFAVTVDHGLRTESALEAKDVAAFCTDHDIPHTILNWTDWDGKGNLQAAARDARYQLMAEWAKANAIDVVMLGHTLDDGAENFLMRLARAAGPDGLGIMNTRFRRYGVNWARPLWQMQRTELRGYLRRHKIKWADDPSNDDVSYQRVKARKALEILGTLGITAENLHQTSFAITQSNGLVRDHVKAAADRFITVSNGDVLITTQNRFDLSPELRRRLFIAAIKWVGSNGYGPRESGLTALETALTECGKGTLGGCIFTQNDTVTRVTREYNAVKDIVCATNQIWDQRWALDGPHKPDLEIRSLGPVGLPQCPDWRNMNMTRISLLATPAIWRDDTLIAAPVAGYNQGWVARIVADFRT